MMCFINDDEIELAFDQALGVLPAPCSGDRSDDPILLPERLRLVAQKHIIRSREGKTEFGLQLFAPLIDQRSWRENQSALRHAAQCIFLEDYSGLDGFTEPDFVGQQNPATELLEDLACRLDLMQQRRNAIEVR